MQNDESQYAETSKHSEVREAAKKALLQILDPIAGFVSDLGFSVGDLQAMLREAAVKSAATRQLENANRINISGIAATTGIPRNEISRILKLATHAPTRVDLVTDGQQQSTNRILAAWHEDPKFTGPNGQPADLKIYGRGQTFESLAKKYGRGIPTRAVLDELVRAGAIELLATQKIRAKTSMTVDRGMSVRVIKAFGDRATELLATMLFNMRKPEAPRFIVSFSDSHVSHASLPLFRKGLAVKGADFLADIQESLSATQPTRLTKRRKSGTSSISVTIYYHESPGVKGVSASINRRRNFRREK